MKYNLKDKILDILALIGVYFLEAVVLGFIVTGVVIYSVILVVIIIITYLIWDFEHIGKKIVRLFYE